MAKFFDFALKGMPEKKDFSCSVQISMPDRDSINITYKVQGPILTLLLPEATSYPEFRDNLWQSTCFEFFIASPHLEGFQYLEWNFAPNGHYAVYYFKNIRTIDESYNKDQLKSLGAPKKINLLRTEHSLQFEIELTLAEVLHLVKEQQLIFQPTVILQDVAQNLSYWAVKHPGAKADFHRFDHLPTHKIF